MNNKEKVGAVFFCKESVGIFNENDKEALMKMASEGDLHAACVLVEGIVFHAELNDIKSLLYALRFRFPKLSIEMQETAI